MTAVLNIIQGATTVNLNSGLNYLVSYIPDTLSLSSSDKLLLTLVGSKYKELEPTITESFRVLLTGTTSQIRETYRQISNLLKSEAPSAWLADQGDPVYMQWQPTSGDVLVRSEILRGSVEFANLEALRYGYIEAEEQVEIIIAWTRRFFMEYDTLREIPLTNGNYSDYLAGLDIFNCNDGSGSAPAKRNNYAQIAASDVIGILPTPLILSMRNTYSTAARRFYIGHMANGSPELFAHILEAEDATLGAAGTSTSDAQCSGGDKVVVTNVPAIGQEIFTWTLSALQTSYAVAQWVRPILRFASPPNNSTCSVRTTLKDASSNTVLKRTEYKLLNSSDYLQPILPIKLSPNNRNQISSGALKLVLEFIDSAGGCDFSLDFVQLTPCELSNGFAAILPMDSNATVAAGVSLIADMPEGIAYIESRQRIHRIIEGPIMLRPNRLQRLYILADGSSDAAIARSLAVEAFYRPRIESI